MFPFSAVFAFALLLIPPTEGEAAHSSYVAAVYEHHIILNPHPRAPLSRLEALQHLQKNLDVFEAQAARAAQQVPTGFCHREQTCLFCLFLLRCQISLSLLSLPSICPE